MVPRPGGPAVKQGEGIQLHRVIGVVDVEDIMYDDKRVGFVYVRRNIYLPEWFIVFDMSPNWPDYKPEKDDGRKNNLYYMANIELFTQFSRYLRIAEPLKSKIIDAGFIQAPWILPYPFHNIICCIEEGNIDAANDELLNAFPLGRVKAVIDELDFLGEHVYKKATEEAYNAFRCGHFIAAICPILPIIEGIISKYLLGKIEKLPNSLKGWEGREGKIDIMKEKRSEAINGYFEKALLDVYVEFLEKSELLRHFDWGQEKINKLLPNRHMVLHGLFDEAVFTDINFIKILLILDALDYIVRSKFSFVS